MALATAVAGKPDLRLSLDTPVSRDRASLVSWDKFGSAVVETDRVFLTSPGEKGQMGSIWTKGANDYAEWTTELTFRASGSDRPGGGMVLWLTMRKGETGPVYGSRDQWDGLALIIDSEGGQGSLHGHLNDGTITYAALPEPREQAFASCGLRYRNTGGMVTVRVNYRPGRLRVDVDGNQCFETSQVKLPAGMYFGLSASTFDTPDSFEVFGLKTEGQGQGERMPAGPLTDQRFTPSSKPPPVRQAAPPRQQAAPVPEGGSDSEQVRRLTEHILSLQNVIESNFNQLHTLRNELESINALRPLIEKLDQRLGRVESVVSKTEAQFHGAAVNINEATRQNVVSEISRLGERLDAFDRLMKEHTTSLDGVFNSLSDSITKGGPKIWLASGVLVVVQVLILTAYVVYKKKREGFHQKYL
ncbi:concanavalin A-like lectin/glucanase domain-containing protein [Dipodascopsis tothii]|uniref:concanavalin A-like lectin/glucanase domain-containing protein n=1 Tax=Dipodascopsis tothii TaxID=44089 RepID=UPI0034CF2C54